MRKCLYLCLFTLMIINRTGVAQDYVITSKRYVNIRTNPSTQSYVVGRSNKGDIYELIGEKGEWYVIKMFSQKSRYINKCCATKMKGPVKDRLSLPPSDERCEAIYSSIQALKHRARREATELIPPTVDAELNMNMQHILEDVHILNLFKIYNLNPAVYPLLIEKAVQSNW